MGPRTRIRGRLKHRRPIIGGWTWKAQSARCDTLGGWAWLIFGAILLGLELLLPGFFLIWFGVAAAIVGVTRSGVRHRLGLAVADVRRAVGAVLLGAGRLWGRDSDARPLHRPRQPAYRPAISPAPPHRERARRAAGRRLSVVDSRPGLSARRDGAHVSARVARFCLVEPATGSSTTRNYPKAGSFGGDVFRRPQGAADRECARSPPGVLPQPRTAR